MAKSEYDSKKGMPSPKGLPNPMKGGGASGIGRMEKAKAYGAKGSAKTADQKPSKGK